MSKATIVLAGMVMAGGFITKMVYDEYKPKVAKAYNNVLLDYEYNRLIEADQTDNLSYAEGVRTRDFNVSNNDITTFTEFNNDSSTVHFNTGKKMEVSRITLDKYWASQKIK